MDKKILFLLQEGTNFHNMISFTGRTSMAKAGEVHQLILSKEEIDKIISGNFCREDAKTYSYEQIIEEVEQAEDIVCLQSVFKKREVPTSFDKGSSDEEEQPKQVQEEYVADECFSSKEGCKEEKNYELCKGVGVEEHMKLTEKEQCGDVLREQANEQKQEQMYGKEQAVTLLQNDFVVAENMEEEKENLYEEITATIGKPVKAQLGWLFLSFVPWIIFLLRNQNGFYVSLFFPFLLSVVGYVWRATVHKATMMDKMTPIFFLGMIMISYFSDVWVDYFGGILASVYLSLIWSAILLTDKTMTCDYMRVSSIDSKHFIKSNENLTFIWVLNFILQGAMFFLDVKSGMYILVMLPSAVITFIYHKNHKTKKKKVHPVTGK